MPFNEFKGVIDLTTRGNFSLSWGIVDPRIPRARFLTPAPGNFAPKNGHDKGVILGPDGFA